MSLVIDFINLEQNWNCRIPGFETSTILKQRPPLSGHTSRVGTVLKARRDAEITRISKIVSFNLINRYLASPNSQAHLNKEARELLSQAEMKEGEYLEVLDEVTVPDSLVTKEDDYVNGYQDTPQGTDLDNDDDDDTPIGQTPMVDSSVGTPAESLME